jgi:hypothetical protein
MLKNTMRSLRVGLAAIVLATTGCAATLPITDSDEWDRFRTKFRVGLDGGINDIGLSEKNRTVNVHQRDRGHLGQHSSKKVVLNEIFTNVAHVGIEQGLRYGPAIFKIGTDMGCDLTTLGEIDGPYNRKLQDLPSGYESYGGMVLGPTFNISPFVGVDFEFRDWTMGIEAGIPYTGFKHDLGHYRWDSNEFIAQDSDWSFGRSVSIKAGIGNKWDGMFSIGYRYESHPVSLSGEDITAKTHRIFIVFDNLRK